MQKVCFNGSWSNLRLSICGGTTCRISGQPISSYFVGSFHDIGHRRNHSDPGARETVRKAYELALNHIAQDKDSGEIWSDYIQFLKAGEVCNISFHTNNGILTVLSAVQQYVGRATEDGRCSQSVSSSRPDTSGQRRAALART